MNRPRVLLADDHKAMAQSLLVQDVEIVGIVSDGQALVVDSGHFNGNHWYDASVHRLSDVDSSLDVPRRERGQPVGIRSTEERSNQA